MDHIDAIVLSCSRYHPLAEHMVRRYRALWPEHPFQFHVPFQPDRPSSRTEVLADSPEVVMVASPEPITATVETLLRGRDDDEWVYWCIDDKYPMSFDVRAIVDTIGWLPNLDSSYQGVSVCRCRQLRAAWNLHDEHTVSPWGERFLHRRSLAQFWLHSFVRVGFIRFVFDRIPDGLPEARIMDQHLAARRDGYRLPADMRYLVSEHNHQHLGESTSRGALTVNAVQSLRSAGLPVPDGFPRSDRYVVMPGER